MSTVDTGWRACSTCKQPIAFAQMYYICNVSTCNRKRMGLFFCSIRCWDAHVPMMRHREAWAEEQHAPSRAAWERAQQSERDKAASAAAPKPAASLRRHVAGDDGADTGTQEVLIVVSKLKQYMKQRADMNTSDNVPGVLSDHLRRLCAQAIAHAEQEGRKTVMDRDFLPFIESLEA